MNDHGPASRALHREASGHAAMGPHVLTASFSLRHVTPTWRYDGSQQDASEYLTALFRGLSSFPISRPWETKDPETGSTLDRGGPLLLLPTPVGQDTARLQDLLDAWSGTPAHTALNGQQSLVTVAVARFVEGRKLHYSLSGLYRPISIRSGLLQVRRHRFGAGFSPAYFTSEMDHTVDTTAASGGKLRMTTGRARTMAAHLSRPQNQTCDRLAMEVTYCWCVPFFRTSLLLAPLDLCTYGYGVPLRPGPPASLAGGVFYWLCGTDLFAQQGAERLLFRHQGRTSFVKQCYMVEGKGGAQHRPPAECTTRRFVCLRSDYYRLGHTVVDEILPSLILLEDSSGHRPEAEGGTAPRRRRRLDMRAKLPSTVMSEIDSLHQQVELCRPYHASCLLCKAAPTLETS